MALTTRTYGRHASGYVKPTGSRLARKRRVQTVVLTVLELMCITWLTTHDAMFYPLVNGIVSVLAFIEFPILFLMVFEDKPRHK